MKHIIIIGSGLAGYLLATELSKQPDNIRVTIITADSGEYYLKPVLSAAFAQNKTLADISMFSAAEMADKLAIEVKAHTEVLDIDTVEKIVITKNGNFPYDSCVFATGSMAKKLCFPDANELLSVNSLDDYRVLRESLAGKKNIAIIGGGLVGVEFAHDLTKKGYMVTLFAAESLPLQNLVHESIGAVLAQSMTDIGVEMVLGDAVRNITTTKEGQSAIVTTSGTTFIADLIISAIGIEPNVDLAKKIGLLIDTGIVTNDQGETNIEGIYAIGDCATIAGFNLNYVPPIRKAAAAMRGILQGEDVRISYPAMPVAVKSPSCPIVSCLPRGKYNCKVVVSGDDANLLVEYFDTENIFRGFSLSGKMVAKRQELLAKLDNWLN